MDRLRFFLLAGWLCCAAALLAAESVELPPVVAEAEKITRQTDPDADTVLLDDRQTFTYEADGTGTERDEFWVKILTEKGRQEYRELRFFYNATYSRFELRRLAVIRDGKVIPVDLKTQLREMTEPGQMSQNIYDPANKLVIASVPDLRSGDILWIESCETLLKPRIPDVWCGIVSLQSTAPIRRYEVVVDAPASRPLARHVLKDPVPGTVQFREERQGDRIRYIWVASNVPQVFPEPDMPPLYWSTQRLLLSTVADWADISRWYYRLCRPRLDAVTPELRAKVEELIRDAKTPEERMMALFQFVSKEIRYMGLTAEEVAPGYEPHDVSLTFKNRYGVCRDKMALLVAMLELAGFKAYPVLFYAGTPKDDEVPNNYFNHAIAAVELSPERTVLLDPTFETTTEFLPASMSNMSYLVAHPEGRSLGRSPVVPAERNFVEIATQAELSAEGELSGSSRIDFHGINDQIYRDAFSRWPQDYRRQFFASRLRAALPGAELVSLKIRPEDVRDMSQPLRVELSFRARAVIPAGGGDLLLPLPRLGTDFGAVNFVLGTLGLKERKFPLEIFSTCGVRDRFTLRLPEGLAPVALPHYRPVTGPGLRWTRSCTLQDGVLRGENTLAIDTVRLEPGDYLAFKAALREIESESRACPVFRRDFDFLASRADAVYLRCDSAITLSAADSWTVVDTVELQIRNYAGVKNQSELKVSFNPAWEEVRIDQAEVVAPDGTRHPLTEREIQYFDEPGAAAAPRYPGGKILVVNFPGVEPGAVIRYRLTTVCRERPFFGERLVFAGPLPIRERTVTLTSEIPLRFSPTPWGVERSQEGNTVRYTVRDQPMLPPEPNQAPAWMFAPTVVVSSGDYRELGKALIAALTAAAEQPHAQAAAQAEALTAGVAAGERVRVLRDFVAREIRAAGPGLAELPWSAFSAPDVTLAARYGNSADRAILLYAMLKAVGLPAEFVVAGSRADAFSAGQSHELQPWPVAGEFDRVLVRTGVGIYLNDTSEYAWPGTTPSHHRRGLEATGLTRISAWEEEQQRLALRLELNADGAGEITVTRTLYGGDYEREKRRFAEFTPEERARYGQELADRVVRGAELQGALKTDFSGYPGVLEFRLRVAALVGRSGDYRSLELPLFGTLATALPAAGDLRTTPIWRNDEVRLELSYELRFPADWRFCPTAPALWSDRLPGGECRLSRQLGADWLKLNGSLILATGLLEANDFPSVVSLRRALAEPGNRTLLFEVTKKETE